MLGVDLSPKYSKLKNGRDDLFSRKFEAPFS